MKLNNPNYLNGLTVSAEQINAAVEGGGTSLTTEQTAALGKIEGLEASASQVDAVSNVIDSRLAPIHKKFRRVVNGLDSAVFIRTGDSTRSTLSSEWQINDLKFTSQLGLGYYNNAYPSQTTYLWQRNSGNATLQKLIDNSLGEDGEDTIIEFSLGLNDYTYFKGIGSTNRKADTKASIKAGIELYRAAKPKALMYLCSPNNAQNAERREFLIEIYDELAEELDLFLVDGMKVTKDLNFSSSPFYQDETHLNQYGMLRQSIYIWNVILPKDLVSNISFSEYMLPPTTAELATLPILNGLYDGTGTFFSNASYRCLSPILISSGFRLNVKHKGTRNEVYCFNSSGALISLLGLTSTGDGYIYPPDGTTTIKINISTVGTTWDALALTPTVKYHFNSTHLTYSEIVDGFNSNITHVTSRNGITIDAYGKIGTVGQTLTIDANSKMKWA